MESVKTRAIVARRSDYGEANAILTLITDKLGVVSACAYGVQSKKSRMKAGAQVLCCSDFVLSRKKGDIYRIESMEIADGFLPVCEDLQLLALGNYFCELVCGIAPDDRSALKLLLNTLYMLAYKGLDAITAKAVFELKLMQYAGYMPITDRCIMCGKKEAAAFDFSGGIVCEDCKKPDMMRLLGDTYSALCYILSAAENKLFAFTVSDEIKKNLSLLAESYLLHKSERGYKSLDYLKKIM